MDELEFCVKSLSYPIGMLLEGRERVEGERARIEGGRIVLPMVPFPARCYLAGLVLFNSVDEVDRKRLYDDLAAFESFKLKLLSSKMGKALRPYLTHPREFMAYGEALSIPWLEFQTRKERVEPYLARLRPLMNLPRGEFLRRSSFLGELSVDDGLLLTYLTDDPGEKELINAALGKHNKAYRSAVRTYFLAFKG
ncbi:hypothetical protein [Thermococcus sp.]|uniref:hypothetical protein n=1 Tax=Thermococcus sp. TaxID=35749 RepID=UPI00262EA5BC|nr:hypothetical protein [Thermococcus sp.]